jgi:ABC-type bacteriocin/lantibiotic exporter with double-glycine peptidase domain
MKVRKNWILFHSLGQAYTYIAKICILAVGIVFLYDGSMSLGTLLFFLAFADRIYSPIMAVFEAYQKMMINIAHYEKMEAVFLMADEKNTGTLPMKSLMKNIRFEQVSFAYPSSSREVLSEIDFEIKK